MGTHPLPGALGKTAASHTTPMLRATWNADGDSGSAMVSGQSPTVAGDTLIGVMLQVSAGNVNFALPTHWSWAPGFSSGSLYDNNGWTYAVVTKTAAGAANRSYDNLSGADCVTVFNVQGSATIDGTIQEASASDPVSVNAPSGLTYSNDLLLVVVGGWDPTDSSGSASVTGYTDLGDQPEAAENSLSGYDWCEPFSKTATSTSPPAASCTGGGGYASIALQLALK